MFCRNLVFAPVFFFFSLGGLVLVRFCASAIPHFRARAIISCFRAFAFPLRGLLPVFASRFLVFASVFAVLPHCFSASLLFCFSACPLLRFSSRALPLCICLILLVLACALAFLHPNPRHF